MLQSLDYAVGLGVIQTNLYSLIKIDGKRIFRRTKKKPNETQVFSQKELEQIIPMAKKLIECARTRQEELPLVTIALTEVPMQKSITK